MFSYVCKEQVNYSCRHFCRPAEETCDAEHQVAISKHSAREMSRTYSFRRADFLFSSLSSRAASLNLTSDPGALAGMMSSWSSLL